MSTFTNLTIADFKQLTKLISKKESLLQKVRIIDAALNALEESGSQVKIGRRVKISRKGSKRGKLKEQILAALKEAGAKGHSVLELSEKLKIKAANIYTWFYTTGKKVSGLKKSKQGRYSL